MLRRVRHWLASTHTGPLVLARERPDVVGAGCSRVSVRQVR